MKKNYLLCLLILILCTACSKEDLSEPEFGDMSTICELAVTDCYYNNVAKYKEEGSRFWIKDKQFWVEYSGSVRMGVDTNLVKISPNGDVVTITIPEAKVLSTKVDENSLKAESFYLAKGSGSITSEEEKQVFIEAEEHIVEVASSNTTMLLNAKERAKSLLADYVTSVGDALGKQYRIEWVNVDQEGNEIKA